MLESDLKERALREGGIRAGIARREAFSEAPPSADMRYLRPWANAVVSFAVTTGTEWIPDYLGKVTRMVIRDNMHHIYHEIYRIASVIAKHLENAGFKAHAIIPNGLYRPDHTFEKQLPDRDVKPPVSLRYMAVGAGVGTFGWSGNVMVPGYWSNVYLGGVLTDARLEPDPPMQETLCDDCRICARVCPVGFIDQSEQTGVTIGGRQFAHNKKRGDLRCVIGCGGFPSFPAVHAAHRSGVPVMLLEQNAVAGRANSWLARGARVGCLSFESARSGMQGCARCVETGNPVRREIAALTAHSKRLSEDRRSLLILGGSQGAGFINRTVPDALALQSDLLRGWHIVHQTGPSDYERICETYRSIDLPAEVRPFLDDMPSALAAAGRPERPPT